MFKLTLIFMVSIAFCSAAPRRPCSDEFDTLPKAIAFVVRAFNSNYSRWREIKRHVDSATYERLRTVWANRKRGPPVIKPTRYYNLGRECPTLFSSGTPRYVNKNCFTGPASKVRGTAMSRSRASSNA